jgi:exopolysaccharide production protein ExoZ
MRLDSAKQTNTATFNFYGVQALRGMAACMVVCHHATQLWSINTGSHPPYWETGAAGVDIFFVISGFVMAISSIGKGDGPLAAWEFLKRRLIRIVPLYWILTSLMLIKIILVQLHPSLGHGSDHISTSLPYIISSYFFIPYRNSLGNILPLLEVGWTLSFEMLFYLWFTGALALRISVVRLLTPGLLILAAIGIFYRDSWPPFTTLAHPLLLEFLAGLWLGRSIQKGLRINASLSALLGTIGIIGLIFLPTPSGLMRPIVWGIPAFLITLSLVMLEEPFGRFLPRWILLIGDASYSLYLSHALTFTLCYQVLLRLHVLPKGIARVQDEVVTALICLIISVPVSCLLYSFVENPLNKGLRRRFSPLKRKSRATEIAST